MELLGKIERQLNHILELDEEALRSLGELDGQVISLELTNTNFKIFILPSARGLLLQTATAEKEDVKIRGTVPDMLAYLLKANEKSGSFAGSIEVTGDVGLAQNFQSILKNIDIDWEEQLAQWFGDTVAHSMARLLRGAATFAADSCNKLQQDVSEYLRFETAMTPDKTALDEYASAVDTLRNDAERLKLRINRLEQGRNIEAK